MIRAITVLFFIAVSVMHAEDALLEGGESPDRRYQVRIYQTDNLAPSDYYFGVVDTRSGKMIKTLDTSGGYCTYKPALGISKVLWNQTSDVFAISDRGTKHSLELYFYEVAGTDIRRIELPNFFQNALGRIGATEGYLTAVVRARKWDGDILNASLTFDATIPGKGRSPQYETQFAFDIQHGPNSSPCARFIRMDQPQPKE
jgi:hypothetical protein